MSAGGWAGLKARAWIDGGARGNPGPAGFGAVIEADGEMAELFAYLGQTTNNVAEYCGLLAVLAWAVEHRLAGLVLHSDSQLMVRQLAGQYKVKAAHLAPLHQRALALRRQVPGFQLLHVPREQNNRADGLANRAIDERTPPPAWLAPHLPATGR